MVHDVELTVLEAEDLKQIRGGAGDRPDRKATKKRAIPKTDVRPDWFWPFDHRKKATKRKSDKRKATKR